MGGLYPGGGYFGEYGPVSGPSVPTILSPAWLVNTNSVTPLTDVNTNSVPDLVDVNTNSVPPL